MHRNIGTGSWIARRARMTPQRRALHFRGRDITYAELDARITCLARGLHARGIGEHHRVAVLTDNHPAVLETLFACGLLGATMVPLHPGFDRDALEAALTRVQPDALVVAPDLLPVARSIPHVARIPLRFTTGIAAEGVERYEDLLASGSDEPLDRPVGLEQTCVLAFSSGTTGPSKVVQLTHANLLFNALNTLAGLDYVEDDVLLVSAPLYRMGGLGFCTALLLKGGCCVLQRRADPRESLRLIAHHRVSVLFDAVHSLDALGRDPGFPDADLSSVRVCVTGGTFVPPTLAAVFRQRGIALQSGYGLTEAAPLALMLGRQDAHDHPGASGRPALFCTARVVDRDFEDVAPGQTGELLLHGPNVTPGYLDAPAANARAFTDGWLRTGDAARIDADGVYTVVGRVADALILDGRTIHPAPLEAALSALEGVGACAIVQRAPQTPAQVFVAPTGTADPANRVSAQTLSRCRDVLAPHLTGFALHWMTTLPTNPNGKVLREPLRRAAASTGGDARRAEAIAAHSALPERGAPG